MKSLPTPIQNLVTDMRNRKMLPLVILLLLAIVAIPFLLGEDPPPPPSTTSASVSSADAADFEGAEITDPVVLAEVPGIRDFRKRLSSFQKQNPFKQQLSGNPKSAKKGGGGKHGGTGAGTTPVTSTPTTPTTNPTGTDPGTGSDPGTGTGGGTIKQYLYYWEIDAKVGAVGKADKKTGIKQLEFLPGNSHPVVQFIRGVDEASALFVVSRSVGDTHGDGRCAPRPNDCQFLALEPGQSQTFQYEPNGLQYKIKLTAVHLKRKQIDPDNPAGFASTDDALNAFASGG